MATGISPLWGEDALLGMSLRTCSSAFSTEVVIAHAGDRRQEGLILNRLGYNNVIYFSQGTGGSSDDKCVSA